MAVRPNKNRKGEIIPESWVIDYYPEGRKGQRLQRRVAGCTELEARAIELQLRRRAGGIKNLVNPRIVDVLPDWIQWLDLHRAKKTVESVHWAIKHLKPHFGHMTVGEITETHINKYKTARRATVRSCNLEIAYLKSLVTWMVERKLCDPLPFRIPKLPYEAPPPQIPTTAELQKWLDVIDSGPKKALIYIMLGAGLRYVEASRLQWSDVNLGDNVIYYTAKGGRKRASVLPPEAIKILGPVYALHKEENNGQPPTGWIAANPKTGEPFKSLKTMFKTASKKSGVNIKGPHTLRHICGTYTLEATHDLRLVQATLGHSQVGTTERYTQISLARLRAGQLQLTNYTQQSKEEDSP